MNQSWDTPQWQAEVLAAARNWRKIASDGDGDNFFGRMELARVVLLNAVFRGDLPTFPRDYEGDFQQRNREALAQIEKVGGARTIRPDEIVKIPFTDNAGETLGTCAINVGGVTAEYHFTKLGMPMIYSTACAPQANPANNAPPAASSD